MNIVKRAVVPFFLLALLAQQSSHAQKGSYIAYGPIKGTVAVSCAAWGATPESSRTDFRWWVYGFVSGAGHVLAKNNVELEETDLDGITAWVTTYCAEHPLDSIIRASISLVDELRMRPPR